MRNNFWRVLLIAVLIAALARPGKAETLTAAGDQIVIGLVVVGAAIGVGVTFLILHEKHKTITGCVSSGANGMSLTDEKDKRTYAVTGNPVGLKSGDRMTLEGKRKNADKGMVIEARLVTKDLGPCQP